MKSLKELSAVVLNIPQLKVGIIQQTESLGEDRITKNSSGRFDMGRKLQSEYRCFVRTDEKHCEASRPTALEAVKVALEGIGIPLPKDLL